MRVIRSIVLWNERTLYNRMKPVTIEISSFHGSNGNVGLHLVYDDEQAQDVERQLSDWYADILESISANLRDIQGK